MAIFFYIFAAMIIISSFLVIVSKNPVYSVLWLIFAFCNAAGLMILIGAEFIAMVLIIVYVGAIAVLFLFVIMMLNINIAKLKADIRKNFKLGSIIALLMLLNLSVIILLGTKSINLNSDRQFITPQNISNVHAIGQILYTDLILPFQMAGIILFVAMISCISLIHRTRPNVKKQDISKQLDRNKENSINLVKISSNSGINDIKYDE